MGGTHKRLPSVRPGSQRSSFYVAFFYDRKNLVVKNENHDKPTVLFSFLKSNKFKRISGNIEMLLCVNVVLTSSKLAEKLKAFHEICYLRIDLNDAL